MHKHNEPHTNTTKSNLNWLRAAVLGANDGIVSIAGLVLGVAAATTNSSTIITAGIAGVVAGAISMAAGEYVSVSSSRDTERALLKKERDELINFPKEELQELAEIYENKGLSKSTAITVAKELTKHDAFRAHADAELGIDPNDLTDPWHAAFASALAFFVGAIIPLIAIVFAPEAFRIIATFVSVLLALAITGSLGAWFGGANILRGAMRVVAGGALAMAVTYAIGSIFHI
jgi:vacuolar iron transporter family protein